MKNVLNKMMNKIQFIKENNIVANCYYIYKANKLFKMIFIAPRPLWHEWKSIVSDFEMGNITPREMYQQSLSCARRYKLA
jgi:hypothetical protein